MTATRPLVRTHTADLILVRLALPGRKPPAPSAVRKDVGALLGAELASTEFDDVRNGLVASGALAKGKRNTYTLTPAGRERALRFLGITDFPPRANWGTVVVRYLFPKAAGLTPEQATTLDTGDKLAALVLKRKYGLPTRAGGTVGAVLEALACRELGRPELTTLDGLFRTVLSQLLGSDERLSKENLRKQFPLFETGLKSGKADAIRRKLIRDWLDGERTTADRADRTPSPLTDPFDLTAFANTVLALARTTRPQDRFHDNKVFIAPLWRLSQTEPIFPRLTLAEFKQRLIEANADHLLHLSRADLVQAMDPTLVAESETTYLNATFHFVRLEGDRP